MTKMKYRFHYTDEKDMETTPEKAARITLLSLDENQKICNRIDWIRDESQCMNCNTSDELEVTFDRTDAIIEMKKLVKGLVKDFKNKSSEHHDKRDTLQTLVSALKLLDDSLYRLYSEACVCEDCKRESSNDNR